MAAPVDPGITHARRARWACVAASWLPSCAPPEAPYQRREPIAAAIEPYVPALDEPPYNMQVGNGTWGVDFDESRTVVNSGLRSVHFRNTYNTADPYIENKQPVEVDGSASYTGEFVMRADSIAAGNTVKGEIRWLDANWDDISQSTIYDAVLTAANTWETKRAVAQAPSTAKFARVRVSKNNTAFNAYLDAFDLISAVTRLGVLLTSPQSVPTGGGGTVILYDDVTSQSGDIDYNAATGEVTIKTPGIYYLRATGTIASLANGANVQAFIGPNVVADQVFYNWSGGTLDILYSVSYAAEFVAGSFFLTSVIHNHGSNRNISAASAFVVRIE